MIKETIKRLLVREKTEPRPENFTAEEQVALFIISRHRRDGVARAQLYIATWRICVETRNILKDDGDFERRFHDFFERFVENGFIGKIDHTHPRIPDLDFYVLTDKGKTVAKQIHIRSRFRRIEPVILKVPE